LFCAGGSISDLDPCIGITGLLGQLCTIDAAWRLFSGGGWAIICRRAAIGIIGELLSRDRAVTEQTRASIFAIVWSMRRRISGRRGIPRQ
jgi:hypothetical protein